MLDVVAWLSAHLAAAAATSFALLLIYEAIWRRERVSERVARDIAQSRPLNGLRSDLVTACGFVVLVARRSP